MHCNFRAYSCLGPFKKQFSFKSDFLLFCFRIYFSNFFYHFFSSDPAGYVGRALNIRDVLRGVAYCICKLLLRLLSLYPNTFDVEIDAASMSRSVVFEKISSFRNNVLLVVPNGERLRRIFQYLQNDIAKRPATFPPVSFVLWSHFLINGCRFSEVIQFPSGDRGVLPISIK